MIVDVCITPEGLIETSTLTSGSMARLIQKQLASILESHAYVLFPSDEHAKLMIRSLGDRGVFTVDDETRWKEILVRLKNAKRLRSAYAEESAQIARSISEESISSGVLEPLPETRVIVVNGGLLKLVFRDVAQGHARLPDGSTLALPDALDELEEFRVLLDLKNRSFHPLGTSRMEVWRELFAPLVRVSRSIVLFDRYLLQDFYGGRQNDSSPEHVRWFLERISTEAAPDARVTLVFETGGRSNVPSDPMQVLADLDSVSGFSLNTQQSVEVVVGDWVRDRGLPHNRHIRFGGLGYRLIEGFDRLSKADIRDQSGFNWQFLSSTEAVNALVAAENRVRTSPFTRSSEVASRGS